MNDSPQTLRHQNPISEVLQLPLRLILVWLLILLSLALGFHEAVAQTVFVANRASGTVSVIRADSNTLIDTVPVGVQPMQVEVSPDGERVYVSNYGSETISVIDVASRTVVATVPVGHNPYGVAVSPDNLKVYVTHASGANEDFVWVIDVPSLTASLGFSLPNQADAAPTATFHPNGSEIWIQNGCGDGCTRRVSYPGHVVLGDLPSETAGANATENHFSFVPGTQILYAAHSCGCCGHFDRSQYSPSITYTGRRYEDGQGAAKWTVAGPVGGIAYLARHRHCSDWATVIRKESAAGDSTLASLTIPAFGSAGGAITSDGARLYCTGVSTGGGPGSVAVVDTASMIVVATIPVGDQPFGIAIAPEGTVENLDPVVTLTGPPSGSIYPVNTPVTFTASYTDPDCGPHIAAWQFDDLSPNPADTTLTEPNGATPGSATATYTFTAPGVYRVKLTVDDSCGGSGTADRIDGMEVLVVVYDPSAGFVTGGGWIESKPGAYLPDPGLSGRANFGFVSKYQKGASVPTGQTEFIFRVAALNFHSTAYQWLVVAGAKAQYKGVGQINSAGNYGFLLTATDGQLNGGGGTDKFRIKIWDVNNADSIVYDNALGASDDIDNAAPQAIDGGSIVIHK